MKCGVVVFPGSNCDHDTFFLLKDLYGHETVMLWHKDADLQGCDFIILPGGFSYGDYLRSGAVARFSPIMKSIIDYANNGGLLFGICNGFQVLCEAHLLPGVLLRNDSQKFICKNVFIKADNQDTPATRNIPEGTVLKIPIAHAEGRYFADEKTIQSLETNSQIMFRYCDEEGNVNATSNVNGSTNNIAGICNFTRNVFGMMPHPERASEAILSNLDGRLIFDSIFAKVASLA